MDKVVGSFKKTGQSYTESMKKFTDGSKELTKTEKEEADKRAEIANKAKEKQDEINKKLKEDKENNLKIALEKRKEELAKYNEIQKEFDLIDEESKAKKIQADKDAMNNDLANKIAVGNNSIEENKRKGEQELADDKAISEAKKAIQDGTFNNISSGIGLLKGLFEKNKGLQKALLIGESAAGIAKIIINTRAANAAARLKYSLLPGGIALAAAESTMNNIGAGIGIATNIAATAKGLSALGGGGSASGASVGGDSGGGASAPAAPQFNVVGASSTNQLAQSIGQQQNQPIKAYVVGADVTTQQGLDRNIVTTATL